MIRAGREAIDRAEVTALHGLTASQAARRKPWADPGHPLPINQPGGRKGPLWDLGQVRAHIAGDPVPPLPTVDDPADLLDASEAASLAGIKPASWVRYAGTPGALPAIDREVYGQPHWRRDSVQEWLPARPGSGAGGGRPLGNGLTVEQVDEQAAELIARATEEGRSMGVRELARALGVAPNTATVILRRVTEQQNT
ncbi:hypothetical protein Ae168Ps1_6365c [Pseudonocardia sp. Ae168_Ps1]|uniref:hypothetical protein n=1 Tax=unclassified Pseudonocardia TaxID=2619320 RepID=UPI00094ABFDB|nr:MULTISPECIES: hypothetical protein [unclassified Pseudonocardia]OLL69892.1 hypothetical protein Ae150APs1_6202 [Pseudonocardia sp. Ae150A_Ps1]OLL70128.1 hypothetical protein Ae168Ps1_6365c [Pseudonocardia sp. Ae168_Ps1]OLL70399.1 hypothetical protein Ae263Ps1_6343c [Pseudonocardia sp. Ae263_Ps1]OLL89180.1 hypothetical protein Ae356Ps1_6208c [Pseudonocardia sp. Ae356_Ps1]